MRVILAMMRGDDSDADVLGAALPIARRFRSHIEAHYIRPDPRTALIAIGEMPATMVDQIYSSVERDAAAAADAARERFQRWQKDNNLPIADAPTTEGPTVAYRETVGTEDRVIGAAGRLADIVVIAQPPAKGSGQAMAAIEAAIVDTGRPVLIVPEKWQAGAIRNAVIAWNGSREAARAVRAALPLLTETSDLAVFAAAEKDRALGDAAEALRYLAWHGRSGHAVRPGSVTHVGEALVAAAAHERADLIVMGAYTHSRMRQLVFGGATSHLIEHANVPVLMMH